ncbi:MAG: tetratricopeptide repeat protein [Myxococcota bacterium]|nr:tetratricopeptide repeat protein [Myxococcota bacterium]
MRFRGRLVVLIGFLGFSVPAWGSAIAGQSAENLLTRETAAVSAQEKIEQAWFAPGGSGAERVRRTRRLGLEAGQANLEGPARALIALEDPDQNRLHAEWAVTLAPDLPLAHAALAQVLFAEGEYREALIRTLGGAQAIPRHVESRLWLGGTLFSVASAALILGALVFILFSGLIGFSRAAHDLGDLLSRRTPGFARVALLLALVGLPVALGEGLAGLLLGGVGIGVLYGGPRDRLVLGLAIGLLVLGFFPILRMAGATVEALDADPVVHAGLAVTRNAETAAQVDALQEAERQGDSLAARLLAFRAMRHGQVEEATDRFEAILAADSGDPFVLMTLGNMAFRAGRTAEAIAFYDRARALDESPLVLFDLAQAYARDFHMAEFERTLGRAQVLDPEAVEELSAFGDADFVVQAPFPLEPLRQRMFEGATGEALAQSVRRWFAPGWLGDSARHLAGGLFLVFFVGMLLAGWFQQAGRCSRCGIRICARCDDSIWSSHVCDGCHQLFSRPQGTDPQLRVQRLGRLREREQRIGRLHAFLRWGVPGVAGFLGKRPDLALISIVFFWATLALTAFSAGVLPDPLAIGLIGTFGLMMLAVLMGAGYLLTTWRGASSREHP